jgi:hypothetical protein
MKTYPHGFVLDELGTFAPPATPHGADQIVPS